MTDLFESAAEMAEERAGILEFEALLTREEAEKRGLLESEEWRHACEVRRVSNMPSLSARREYLASVESQRGKKSADKLRSDIQREWLARRVEMAGQP